MERSSSGLAQLAVCERMWNLSNVSMKRLDLLVGPAAICGPPHFSRNMLGEEMIHILGISACLSTVKGMKSQ
jgi:hypothetical protein